MRKLFKIMFLAALVIATGLDVYASKKTVHFGCSESDAKIYLDGKLMGTGQLDIIVPAYACVTVKVEKTAYLTETITFCNKQNYAPPPKNYYCQMKRDDAYDASEASDMANIDIEIKTTKPEQDAWRLISQIITSYFDVIEVTDRETGYLRTSWVVQQFEKNTIRTRMIVKLGSTDPLTYKVKLISEYSGQPLTSVKSDELFREWDRILRKYKEVIHEIQSRLGS